ncbi:hypothetical protein HOY82DRAFT_590091 [Tuber indicum]|nr:hypothetical protein HOY82DRAFT_590091 [Tuber indicum]
MSAPTIDETIFALSNIAHKFEYHPSSPPPASSPIPECSLKRLKQLNLLALLLVTEGTGDVAATSIRITEELYPEVCFAKNRPCTPNEKSYIDGILSIVVNHSTSTKSKFTDIFNLVLNSCKKQITVRLKSICFRLRELQKLSIPSLLTLNVLTPQSHNPHLQQCEADIRSLVGEDAFSQDIALSDFLPIWFNHLCNRVEPNIPFDYERNDGLLYQALHISFFLVQGLRSTMLLDPTLYGSIAKLGDYVAAISVLIQETEKLDPLSLAALKFTEITPPFPFYRKFPFDYLSIINRWAAYHGFRAITLRELRRAYPQAKKFSTSTKRSEQTVNTTVHCECWLSLAFTNAHMSAGMEATTQVGVSKLSCWLCREYIKILHQRYPYLKVHVSGCHGKLTAGWRLPSSIDIYVIDAMQKRVDDALEDVIKRCLDIPIHDTIAHSQGVDGEYFRQNNLFQNLATSYKDGLL